MAEKKVLFIGKVVGRLTTIRDVGKSSRGYRLWLCQCACGNAVTVESRNLNNGHTKSCGCYHRDRTSSVNKTHGKSNTRTHEIWMGIRSRCNNPNYHSWPDYGGRGITVCKGWSSYESFLADMGECPEGLTIERLDNNKGYWCGKCLECRLYRRPANCKWATVKEQAKNRRTSHRVTHNSETMIVTDWAERLGIHRQTLYLYLNRGLTLQEIIDGKRR